MLADRRLAENIAKCGVWQMLVAESIARRYDISVHGRAQPEHDNTLRQLTVLPGEERRAKPGKPSASHPMQNGTNQGKRVCPADVSCKTHRKMQCLANETRRGHRKSCDLAGIACSPAPFRECGLRALRNTTFLQTSRQSTTASHCSCRCFAQAF